MELLLLIIRKDVLTPHTCLSTSDASDTTDSYQLFTAIDLRPAFLWL